MLENKMMQFVDLVACTTDAPSPDDESSPGVWLLIRLPFRLV